MVGECQCNCSHCMLPLLQQILLLNVSNAQTVIVSGANIITLEDDRPFEVRNRNLELICARDTNETGEVDVSVLDSQTELPFRKLLTSNSLCSVDVGMVIGHIIHHIPLVTGPPNPPRDFTFTITATSVNVSWLSPSEGT